MAKNNKVCPICGKGYSHCDKCEKIGSWKVLACSPECYQIYSLLAEIREGVLTESDVVQKLKHFGVTADYAKANFIPSVAKIITVYTNINSGTEDKSNKSYKSKK